MKLSVVTTLYYSAPYINEFYERITKEAKKITDEYEIIFVNDGSPDNSLSKAVSLYQDDKKVTVIDLSRNFGHHKAIMTGLAHAKGEFIFLIDVDLEEEPEWLGEFWSDIHSNDDVDVVFGVQEVRKGGFFEKISGSVFYKLLNYLSDTNIPKNLITCRLTTERYNKALISHKEQEIFLAGLWSNTGFKQMCKPIKKHSHSPSTYHMRNKISLLIKSITSFSKKPLIFIFNIGFIITIISSIYLMYLMFNKLFFHRLLDGWTSIMVSVWFFGGLNILFLGIIGMYIAGIFTETKNRPYTIIKDVFAH